MLCLGLVGLVLQMERTLSKGLFTERQAMAIRLAVPLSVLVAPIGACVLYNVLQVHRFDPKHWDLGFTFYGMWLTVFPLCWLIARFGGLRLIELLNLHAIGLAFAHACGRVGCFLGGCCFGCPVPWGGVRYPLGSLPDQYFPNTMLCPIQLYEAVFLFALAVVLDRKIALHSRFLVYVASYAIARFVLEFFRGDPRGKLLDSIPFSPAQVICICIVAVYLGWFSKRLLRFKWAKYDV